ncbi:MAG: DNA polymerase III subunit delta' [Actinomycetaceae bacterium]|nr:DNA polymerase III subunit delta' [Actinomycetaceae bacterium]
MSVWEAVIGQPRAVDAMREAATHARRGGGGGAMTHSWLVTGPPGSGRSTLARAFAAALQCSGEPVGCGACEGCRTTLAGTHGDVTDLATDKVIISIDEVRALVQAAQTAPTQGQWRVIVVEDADRMQERTSNVLLKAIEEPPERTVWLLCAPSPDDMITTIRSRCRQVRLQTPPVGEVAAYLQRKFAVDEDVAVQVAQISQSHIGVASRLAQNQQKRENHKQMLMQIISASSVSEAMFAAQELIDFSRRGDESADGESGAAATTAQLVDEAVAKLVRQLGYESEREVPRLLKPQVTRERENAKRRFERADRDILDMVLVNLLGFYRDVLVRQLGAQVPIINADLGSAVDLAASHTTAAITQRRIRAVEKARERIAHAVTPLVAVEAMMVALAG